MSFITSINYSDTGISNPSSNTFPLVSVASTYNIYVLASVKALAPTFILSPSITNLSLSAPTVGFVLNAYVTGAVPSSTLRVAITAPLATFSSPIFKFGVKLAFIFVISGSHGLLFTFWCFTLTTNVLANSIPDCPPNLKYLTASITKYTLLETLAKLLDQVNLPSLFI